jgi:hypothetical protein
LIISDLVWGPESVAVFSQFAQLLSKRVRLEETIRVVGQEETPSNGVGVESSLPVSLLVLATGS